MRPRLIFYIFYLLIAGFAPHSFSITIQPVPDGRGPGTLGLAVLRLPVVASMLHTGAHPDDENSALVAYVSRGLHARTAYLSLNRGEGGQNLIGPELYDSIGIIRTEELLSARRYDGAQQFFTRAYDFGFSKSAEEALTYWNHDEMLLSDVVRIIRRFRPDVIISVFADSPHDGHGQHQASGRITREAFYAAADPERFPEHFRDGLGTWQVRKLFVNNMRASFASLDSLQVEIGTYSPLLDRSFRELGLAGRSMHRSQDMGTLQLKGPATTKIKLVAQAEMKVLGDDSHIFDGLDTTFMRLHTMAGPEAEKVFDFAKRLSRINMLALEAVAKYRAGEPSVLLDPVLEGLRIIRSLKKDLRQSTIRRDNVDDILFLLDHKEKDFTNVVRLALGMAFEVLSGEDRVVPGDTLGVNLQLLNRSSRNVNLVSLDLKVPPGWVTTAEPSTVTKIGYNESVEQQWRISVPLDAPFTQPYWHRRSLNDRHVIVEDESLIGRPWSPQAVVGQASFVLDGIKIEICQPVQYRFADRALGEIRRELQVVPALSVTLEPKVVVSAEGHGQPLKVNVTLLSNVNKPLQGTLQLETPPGWEVSPSNVKFSFSRKGQKARFSYMVTPNNITATGAYEVQAVAKTAENNYDEGYEVVAYPHTEPRHLYSKAKSTVRVTRLDWPSGLKVGYIMGTGDRVPHTLRQLGLQIQMLTTLELTTSDLGEFDLIIAGIRAYEVRHDLVAANQRLLDYVKSGGLYIVQYNRYVLNQKHYGPYPFRINRPHDRVTQEDAPVKILVPDHPIFNNPNQITEADFEGWVQERGLYFLGEWDHRYTPLMASQDKGETPREGGLVEARYGKGRYIYTGYAWFRQLPAGVPGALRLFTNLISLAKNRHP